MAESFHPTDSLNAPGLEVPNEPNFPQAPSRKQVWLIIVSRSTDSPARIPNESNRPAIEPGCCRPAASREPTWIASLIGGWASRRFRPIGSTRARLDRSGSVGENRDDSLNATADSCTRSHAERGNEEDVTSNPRWCSPRRLRKSVGHLMVGLAPLDPPYALCLGSRSLDGVTPEPCSQHHSERDGSNTVGAPPEVPR